MSETTAAAEQADPSSGRRRRLMIVVGIAGLAVLTFLVANAYAERRVIDEDLRVQRVAATLTVDAEAFLDTAFGSSDEIAAAFGVPSERVSIYIAGTDGTCIAVRSEYFTSTRTSSFSVGGNGTLTPTAGC